MRDTLGNGVLVKFRVAFAIVLAPGVLVAAYSLWSHRPAILIWVLLAMWGFGTASTGPTGIGMLASLIVAIAGVGTAILQRDWLFVALGLMPGCTWFASCAVLGTTASYLLDALRASPELADSLARRGILMPARQ